MSARSFFGYSREEQEAGMEAEIERHQKNIIDQLAVEHPDKLAQLRERPWQAGWFVARVTMQMGRDVQINDAWRYVLLRAFSSTEQQDAP